MSYFIDSNIFLRYFAKESSSKKVYEECFKLIKQVIYSEKDFSTSSIVFAEVNWVMQRTYKIDKKNRIGALDRLNNLNLTIFNEFDSRQALEFYRKHKVKYIDCLISSIPQIASKKWTVISYDKDFDKLGVKRLEPKDII